MFTQLLHLGKEIRAGFIKARTVRTLTSTSMFFVSIFLSQTVLAQVSVANTFTDSHFVYFPCGSINTGGLGGSSAEAIAVLAWVKYSFDLTSIPLSYKERGFESYSPSLVGKGLGVRSVLDSTANRYIYRGSCFSEAYAVCQPATISANFSGIDSGSRRQFFVVKEPNRCLIVDVVENYVVPRLTNDYTYLCDSIQQVSTGLLVKGCGQDEDVLLRTSL